MIQDYIQKLFVNDNGDRDSINQALSEIDISANCVSKETGKFLSMLVSLANCKQILEIGTSGGYSTMWLAKALNPLGHITTIEVNPVKSSFAKKYLANKGLADLVTFLVGDALEILKELKSNKQCYDLIFVDADKVNYINYLEIALRITRSGSLIITDNVLWRNRIFDEQIQDESTNAIREFNRFIAGHHALESILLPLGDGILISRVV